MYLRYGDYTHDLAEVKAAFAKEAVLNDVGQVMGYRERWVIDGRKDAASVALLTTSLQALEAAYRSTLSTQDIVLLASIGPDVETVHKIIGGQTTNGIKVKMFSYPIGDMAQYSTFRDYHIEVEAEVVPSGGPGSGLRSFSERVTIIGTGGPRRVTIEIRNGTPVEQIVSQSTPVMAEQAGRAVAFGYYPSLPPPIWPAYENVEQRAVTLMSVKANSYASEWSYRFTSPGQLSGTPHFGF